MRKRLAPLTLKVIPAGVSVTPANANANNNSLMLLLIPCAERASP